MLNEMSKLRGGALPQRWIGKDQRMMAARIRYTMVMMICSRVVIARCRRDGRGSGRNIDRGVRLLEGRRHHRDAELDDPAGTAAVGFDEALVGVLGSDRRLGVAARRRSASHTA